MKTLLLALAIALSVPSIVKADDCITIEIGGAQYQLCCDENTCWEE